VSVLGYTLTLDLGSNQILGPTPDYLVNIT